MRSQLGSIFLIFPIFIMRLAEETDISKGKRRRCAPISAPIMRSCDNISENIDENSAPCYNPKPFVQ